MKFRLRLDLRLAMRSGQRAETALLRQLIAAIDNAEAVPVAGGARPAAGYGFHDGSAEVARLRLSADQVRAVLLNEIKTRLDAATTYERLGDSTRSSALQADALLVRRYLS
ncbi:MAG: hypothetical protein MO852_09035 [Candidatus Devosia euplotis]|nr:hypothetical protein [Candidatus Devosia euplotis]